MDKIKNGAEEIYLAPETESSEELVLDEHSNWDNCTQILF